ncbi:MAG: hypothetical protein KC420_23320, partial [Myxococcales bacterium]|nr:hypothetical protein [Myxococcales bacterium]
GYSTEILAWAARPESLEPLPEAARPRGREVRALLSRFLEQLPSGMSRAVAEYGRALVELPPASG